MLSAVRLVVVVAVVVVIVTRVVRRRRFELAVTAPFPLARATS